MAEWNKESIEAEARKYTSRIEFQKGSNGAYKKARKLGIIDDVCSHMAPKERVLKWDAETILNLAKKFKYRSEFQKECPGAYNAARRRGILKQVCEHMTPLGNMYLRGIYSIEFDDGSVYVGLTFNFEKRMKEHFRKTKCIVQKAKMFNFTIIQSDAYYPNEEAARLEAETIQKYVNEGWEILNVAKPGSLGGIHRIWTVETIGKEARKYSSRKEFLKCGKGAAAAARDLGIYEKVCSHMDLKLESWNKQKILTEVMRFSTLDNFYRESPRAYAAACRIGLLDEVTKKLTRKKRKDWSIEDALTEALKYSSRKKFAVEAQGAHKLLSKMGILEEATFHMEKLLEDWTEKKISDEAKKYSSRIEFMKGSLNAYAAGARRNILDKVCMHMKAVHETWDQDKIRKFAKKYRTRTAFAKAEPKAYSAAIRQGVLDEVCSHMEQLFDYWDEESIRKVAKTCKYRYEFQKKYNSAYNAARRIGILEDICAHMRVKEKEVFWTIERIKAEAKKYKRRNEFKKHSSKAYYAALRNGVMDLVCVHME